MCGMYGRRESVADSVSRMARARVRWRRAPAGVTLIELLAVVVMLGLLAAVALPRLAEANLWMAEGQAAACKCAATLRLARRMAVENAADNTLGYVLVCTNTTYRILDPTAGGFGEWIALPHGWQFDRSDYVVLLDPYGGARPAVGLPDDVVIRKGAHQWIIHFEPATGYVWYERGEES